MNVPCYLCRERPAGHPASPVSAYCAECQPAVDPQPPGAFSQCSRCGVIFGTLSAFDDHLVHEEGSPRVLACCPPHAFGLVQDIYGRWLTPAGAAHRERVRHMMAEAGRRRGRAPQSA